MQTPDDDCSVAIETLCELWITLLEKQLLFYFQESF